MNNGITPWLKICPECGQHGCFVFPNETQSEEIVLFEQGEKILERARISRSINGFQHGQLMDQLKKSKIATLEKIFEKISSEFQDMENAIEKMKGDLFSEKYFGHTMN